MTISKTDFFTNNEVLFIGVSSDPKSFSRSVYTDFVKAGIKVYPVSARKFTVEGSEVYSDIDQLPNLPDCAYILLNNQNTKKAVNDLKGKGIKKILFHSKATGDPSTLSECKELGIEAFVACPKMMISKAPIHKLHGFIVGVRK